MSNWLLFIISYRLDDASSVTNHFGNGILSMNHDLVELVFTKIKSANEVALKIEDDHNLFDANKDNKVKDMKRR